MKKLTSYNRAAGYLNRIFDLLNEEYFEGELSRPTITIQSTPKAYGHFSLRDDTWVSVTGSTHEINIGAGTLARPIENVVCTMLHDKSLHTQWTEEPFPKGNNTEY
jgi:autotransporter translocation and assembly factor TamB